MNLWIYGAGQDRERKKVTRTCTTRYVTLVSVVLALALTAALAACGSDEPSGGTGPDRTASTPTETPASPTRTPSTPVPSPTATDAPGTAAATAPPAVSGSAETDREALVALYNATNGENWFESDNWLRGILKKCVNGQAVYPLSEQDGLKAQERRYTAYGKEKH